MKLFLGPKEVEVSEDTWAIVNKLLSSDTPLVRSQYFDIVKSDRPNKVGEVRLWLAVLDMSMDDWLNFKNNPTSEIHKKLAKDINEWAFTESFTLDRICEAMDKAFKIDPDLFKFAFRKWLEKNKPLDLTNKYDLNEPFELIEEIKELI